MQQNASTEYNSASNKVKQLYKALRVTGTAYSCGNWSCSTQDLCRTMKHLVKKSVHDYAKRNEWTSLHVSDPWQEHKSVHARFCSAQTQTEKFC